MFYLYQKRYRQGYVFVCKHPNQSSIPIPKKVQQASLYNTVITNAL